MCAEGSFEPENDVKVLQDPNREYKIHRMILGLPEGSSEMGGQFPLNMNLHLLEGVSFNKGCYIGQELTQRTFHTGVIRKVALPFALDSSPHISLDAMNFDPYVMHDQGFDLDLKGENIVDEKGKKLGKVLTNSTNMGVALVDLTKLNKNGSNHKYSIAEHRAFLWQPAWMDMHID